MRCVNLQGTPYSLAMRKRKNFFSSEQFDFSIERFWRSRNYMGTLFGQDLISFLPLLTNVFLFPRLWHSLKT